MDEPMAVNDDWLGKSTTKNCGFCVSREYYGDAKINSVS